MLYLRSSVLGLLVASMLTSSSEGHGYLKSPRSRELVAAEEGVESWQGISGRPRKEYEPQSANKKPRSSVCGQIGPRKYDRWTDVNGNRMPWTPQATYVEGQEITVEAVITANHWG